MRLDTGEVIRALPVSPAADGRTLVSVRPERLSLLRDGDGETAGNRIAAQVVETIYFGDHVRLHVAAGADPMMLKLPLGAADGLGPGAAVHLGCAPDHCRALDPSA